MNTVKSFASVIKKARLPNDASVLEMRVPEIQKSTGLNLKDVYSLKHSVASSCVEIPTCNAWDMYTGECPKQLKTDYLTTGCDILDEFFQGGIKSGCITEISGESASGKTQICIQLSITAQLPRDLGGLDTGVLYICTEDVFPNKRLVQMVDLLKARCHDISHITFTDNIFIEHVGDLEDMMNCITRKLPVMLDRGRVGLVIIDSVAGLVRGEYSMSETMTRVKKLGQFASQLQKIAAQYNMPVICVNQVSDVIGESSLISGKKVIPALGLSWSYQVSTRLMLARTNKCVNIKCKTQEEDSVVEANVRTMEVVFSPYLPNALCHYIIDQEGAKGLKPD